MEDESLQCGMTNAGLFPALHCSITPLLLASPREFVQPLLERVRSGLYVFQVD